MCNNNSRTPSARIHFEPTGYCNDFEAVVDAPTRFAIAGQGNPVLHLKGYDTSCRETPDEDVMRELGFGFCCEVAVKDESAARHQLIARFAARDRDVASRMMEAFALATMAP